MKKHMETFLKTIIIAIIIILTLKKKSLRIIFTSIQNIRFLRTPSLHQKEYIKILASRLEVLVIIPYWQQIVQQETSPPCFIDRWWHQLRPVYSFAPGSIIAKHYLSVFRFKTSLKPLEAKHQVFFINPKAYIDHKPLLPPPPKVCFVHLWKCQKFWMTPLCYCRFTFSYNRVNPIRNAPPGPFIFYRLTWGIHLLLPLGVSEIINGMQNFTHLYHTHKYDKIIRGSHKHIK